jgi:crotonobetainyl-CoA:carnitine CoA-transferase CaiB-like acyl-CoA transferase
VQTASGINEDEAAAHGSAQPRALPMQALDYGAGFWLAFGVEAALLRQAQGGSWRVTLAGVAHWLRGLGQVQVAAMPGQRPA